MSTMNDDAFVSIKKYLRANGYRTARSDARQNYNNCNGIMLKVDI
ncbi:MAG TPA: hypothetical protein VJ836_01170 [Candidatus Saccharimonadales bacterium]|nr:hypothetical protein [Candidatus Saccharimonadales bacterium]